MARSSSFARRLRGARRLHGRLATPVYEDDADARLTDATLVANANNWLVQDVMNMLDDHETFQQLVEDITDTYPNDFSSAISAASPTDGYRLYFKGSVPSGVGAKILSSGLTVTTYANVGKNHAEWDAQVEAIGDFLEDQLVDDYIVGFDSIDTIELTIGSGITPPTLPQGLSSNVTVSSVSFPVFEFHADVLGGAEATGGSNCTTSWNVVHPHTGTTGTVTAGHCVGINQVRDRAGTLVSSTFQAQRIGLHGDVEWHTTVEPEPARFHADEDLERSVRSVKTRWARNEWVCGYGRSSNVRVCDRIFRTSVRAAGGIRPLVVVQGTNLIPGDSGGGWSLSTQAIGVHAGECRVSGAWRDCFSRAERIIDALGVNVRIAP